MTDSITNPNQTLNLNDIDQPDSDLNPTIQEPRKRDNIAALIQELGDTQGKVINLHLQLKSILLKLDTQESINDEQKLAIAEARKISEQQSQQFEKLNQNTKLLIQTQTRLEATKNEQFTTLESKLQASLQHANEQDDALIHWQELAETTKNQIKNLEKQKDSLERRLKETTVFTGKLQEKNSHLDLELQRTSLELIDLRERMPEGTYEKMEADLTKAKQKITILNEIVADSEEQLLWYKASLKTAQNTVEESRRIAHYQGSLLNIDEQEADSITNSPTQKEQHLDSEITHLKESVRYKSAQLKAHKSEIEHHLKQMDAQGKRLAEIQAILIEREIELEQTIAKSERQSDIIKKIKTATMKRIQHLETQLAKSIQQSSQGKE